MVSNMIREVLKTFLLLHLHQILFELLRASDFKNQLDQTMEYHIMDSKIIQLLIQGIIDSEEYTLEGIAYYTQIPFDVIYDATCGITNHFSITPWTRIMDLYLKVRPDVKKALVHKLLEFKDQHHGNFSSLLTGT